MNVRIFIFILLTCLVLAGCASAAPVCAPEALQHQDRTVPFAAPSAAILPQPEQVTVDGKLVTFDQVVHGQLCNNQLKGKVYIACDITVYAWDKTPNFLDGCNLTVEPGAVITVAAHNNAVYYKGCDSCHQSAAGSQP